MAVETESRLDCSNRSAASIEHEEPERFTSLCAAGNALRALSPWILGFTELRTLDLCHNLLSTCAGIEACRRLAVLDLRGNLLADGATLGEQLSALTSLVELDTRHNPFSRHFSGSNPPSPVEHGSGPAFAYQQRLGWRTRVLRALPELRCLDGLAVDDEERQLSSHRGLDDALALGRPPASPSVVVARRPSLVSTE